MDTLQKMYDVLLMKTISLNLFHTLIFSSRDGIVWGEKFASRTNP